MLSSILATSPKNHEVGKGTQNETRICSRFWNRRRSHPRRRARLSISRTSLRTTTSTMYGDIKGEALGSLEALIYPSWQRASY